MPTLAAYDEGHLGDSLGRRRSFLKRGLDPVTGLSLSEEDQARLLKNLSSIPTATDIEYKREPFLGL